MTPFQLPTEYCETVAQPDSNESKEGTGGGEGGYLDNVYILWNILLLETVFSESSSKEWTH